MILSLDKKFICLNPPKTGSGFRENLFKEYADFYVQGASQLMKDMIGSKPIDNLHKFRHLNFKDCLSFLSNCNLNPDDFYFFTFVRNPWTRVESWYDMIINHEINKHPKLKSRILESRLNIDAFNAYTKLSQHSLSSYLSCEERDVDFCGKLEAINEDIDKLSVFLNINPKSSPNFDITANLTSYHSKIKELWTGESVDIIKNKNLKIIEKFDYKFYNQ